MKKALRPPKSRPIARSRRRARAARPPSILPATAAATNMIAPTERSTPAVSNTKVIPMATMAVEEDWTRMLRRLAGAGTGRERAEDRQHREEQQQRR